MKYLASAFIVGVYLSSSALGSSLYIRKDNGNMVYTNIRTSSFFSRAFKIGKNKHYTKRKVIDMIKKAALKFGVEPKIATTIAKIESDFNHNSVSKSGAEGVMQLMKKTAKYYGVKNINDLKQNIEGGVRFLKHLIKKYKNIKLVVAAYNAGETAVDKYKGIPPYYETIRYVKRFMRAYHGKIKNRTKTFVYIKARPIRRIGNNTYSNIGSSLW